MNFLYGQAITFSVVYTIECAPKSKNFIKFEAKRFFEPELSFDNEDSKNRFNEEVGKIGLFGVGSPF